jgi:hypothetical protein
MLRAPCVETDRMEDLGRNRLQNGSDECALRRVLKAQNAQ